ncbi:MAG: hypothetical protein HY353_04520 [Candidatus Omnitrophica bacterium]|nr:hypothetical protein [Candidatus Omnitrophota bacterium]
MKRTLIITASVVAGLLAIGTIAWWIFLAMWVPTQGKARLEAELERRLPIEVSLGAVRYEFARGIIVENVQVEDRASREPRLVAPLMRLSVGWLGFILQRELAFRLHAEMEVPCQTEVEATGRYHLQRQSLTLNAETTRRPLVWTTPHLQIRTDASVQARASAPRQPGEPWAVEAAISLRDGTVAGPALRALQPITGVEGTVRLTEDTLDIEQLRGMIHGSRWTVKGTVAPLQQPSIELLITSHAELAPLMALVPTLRERAQLSGTTDLLAVVRGPLRPTPQLDTLLHMELRDASLATPKLKTPLTEINGRLDYDMLGRSLTVSKGRVRLLDQQVAVDGTVRFLTPTTVSAAIEGMLPLEALSGLLPPDGALQELAGIAEVNVELEGPLTSLTASGQMDLREASARVSALPHPIEHVTGRLIFEPGRIDVRDASFQFDEQPMSLTGRVTFEPQPVIAATLGIADGRLEAVARVTPEEIVIDEAQLSFHDSRLSLNGAIAREAPRRSRLRLAGTVQMADLTRVPFLPAQGLEPWKLSGASTLNADFDGPLDAWQDAQLRGWLTAAQLGVRDVPIEQLACEFEQQNRALRVRVPSALVADGRFQGELTVRHRAADAEFLAEADLVGLRLERLALAVPAWQKRQIAGTVSSHASIAGMQQQRPAWRGEGWLNASGERLADVPLLDKVFRGLFGMLGDRLGLEALRRAQITQASVTWRLSQERFHTEDLRLGGIAGTEPVAIYARGSVGLDQTLDFVIEPELSEGIVLESPTTSTLASTILKAAGQLERLRQLIGRHRLTGTLKNPDYRFEYGTGEVIKQVAPGPTELLQGILKSLR